MDDPTDKRFWQAFGKVILVIFSGYTGYIIIALFFF
jgi:hypothetical protein